MLELRPCSSCRRHVADEARCPFCDAPLAPAVPARIPHGRLSRAAIFASATLAGCWSSNAPAGNIAHPDDDHAADHRDAEAADKPADTLAVDTKPADGTPIAKTGTIEGTVRNAAGDPVPGFRLSLSAADGAQVAVAVTDANGHYVFRGVAVGNADVEVRISNNPRNGPLVRPVIVIEGAVAHADIALPPSRVNPPNNIPMPYGAPPARHRVV